MERSACHKCFKKEQDKSSDIEQQLPFGDRNISNIQPQNRGGGGTNPGQNVNILNILHVIRRRFR